MFLPGISAHYVPANARLLLAMLFTVVSLPLVGPYLPPLPKGFALFFLMIFCEITIGIFIGIVVEILLAALHVAGTVISFISGLANAMVFDPVTEQQGSMVTGMLNALAVVIIFITDSHHLIFRGMIESYTLFPAGIMPPPEDLAATLVRQVGGAFMLGIKLASPFIVVNIVFQSALGLMSRLMPQMQVFFVAMPIQLLIGLALLMIMVPIIIMWFMGYFTSGIGSFLGPG